MKTRDEPPGTRHGFCLLRLRLARLCLRLGPAIDEDEGIDRAVEFDGRHAALACGPLCANGFIVTPNQNAKILGIFYLCTYVLGTAVGLAGQALEPVS